jgi:hypothetical protein
VNGQDLIWIGADEVVEGDRVLLPSGDLALVCSVEPNLDVPGNILLHHEGGTYETSLDAQVSAAPNPALGEVSS